MKRLTCLILILLFSPFADAGRLPGAAESNVSPGSLYNPREEFLLGVGPAIGGLAGGVGIQTDVHILPRFGVQLGVGSALYLESIYLTARHYFWERGLSPYVGLGYASWRTSTPEKIEKHLNPFAKLGLKTKQGVDDPTSVHLLPLIAGVQYISNSGLAAFAEFEYIFSITSTKGLPYGGIGIQWFF